MVLGLGTHASARQNLQQHGRDCCTASRRIVWLLRCRYTLGGFYLARYEDSPAGTFDEVRRGTARGRMLSMQEQPRTQRGKGWLFALLHPNHAMPISAADGGHGGSGMEPAHLLCVGGARVCKQPGGPRPRRAPRGAALATGRLQPAAGGVRGRRDGAPERWQLVAAHRARCVGGVCAGAWT